jgi:phosphoglycolate phosphatase/AHBA synthesis associated protein
MLVLAPYLLIGATACSFVPTRRPYGSLMGLTYNEGPSAVLFDLDGVLIDSYDVWFEVMSSAARDLGYPPLEADAFRNAWGQSVEDDRRLFFPRHSTEELATYYDTHFASHLEHLTIASGIGAVFEALAARHILTAVVTNTPNPLASELVARTEANPDVIVGANEATSPKPAPDLLLRACELLGAAADQAVMVGDSHFDRDAARAAGCWFVGLGIAGDVQISRLEELPDVL